MWAAVATAIGPGSIWANASDSRNSSSVTQRFWSTVTSRICATIAGPPYEVAPIRKNVLASRHRLAGTSASYVDPR